MMGAYFTAAHDSECAACGAPIWEGELAGYVDDDVCCEECWQEGQDEQEEYA